MIEKDELNVSQLKSTGAVGLKLRYLRELKGLSQLALAKKIGVDKSYINKLERNTNRFTPSKEKKMALCDALDVKDSLLLFGEIN